ncbi:MAG: hypothetical protein EOP10_22485, partial [Proteobacteria bacterium]
MGILFKASPLNRLTAALKAELMKDEHIFAVVMSDESRIDLHRYTQVGEDDVPLIAISVRKEEVRNLSDYDDERSDVSLLVEAIFPRKIKVNPEDFGYHLRHVLLGMEKVKFDGGSFERLSTASMHYVRTMVGKVAVSHVVCEMTTRYDDEILTKAFISDF